MMVRARCAPRLSWTNPYLVSAIDNGTGSYAPKCSKTTPSVSKPPATIKTKIIPLFSIALDTHIEMYDQRVESPKKFLVIRHKQTSPYSCVGSSIRVFPSPIVVIVG